jgi:hypothetical protein
MVSEMRDGGLRSRTTGRAAGQGSSSTGATGQESGLQAVGIGALVFAVAAMVLAFVPGFSQSAWIPALAAIALALFALGMHVGRKLYAGVGLILGWFAFAFSFALMLWG